MLPSAGQTWTQDVNSTVERYKMKLKEKFNYASDRLNA